MKNDFCSLVETNLSPCVFGEVPIPATLPLLLIGYAMMKLAVRWRNK